LLIGDIQIGYFLFFFSLSRACNSLATQLLGDTLNRVRNQLGIFRDTPGDPSEIGKAGRKRDRLEEDHQGEKFVVIHSLSFSPMLLMSVSI
jgi:hypothetical protein